MKNNKTYFLATALLCLMAMALIYVGSAVVRFWPYQSQLVGPVGKLYALHPAAGFVPLANAHGKMRLSDGQSVPTYHDSDGLRALPGVKRGFSGAKHPRILFIGDSFTYGDFTPYQDTFVYRVAEKLGGESINGGVNGYGLAQMVLRARELIPAYKPDYVIVQYSPWLVTRAMSAFGPSYLPIHIPVPYFHDGVEQQEIALPAYPLLAEEVLPESLLLSSAFIDKLHLYFSYVIPNLAYDDANFLWFRLKQFLGIRPPASADAAGIIRRSYAEINDLARASGGEMLVLVLSSDAGPFDVPGELFPPGTRGVNAQLALLQALSNPDNEEYMRQYWRWGGRPLRPIDPHPNKRSHEIIADVVAERIRRREAGK